MFELEEKQGCSVINLDEDIDILKVGHHGGATSTGAALLDKIKPEVAVLSVGQPNRYGHPHDAVLSLLQERAIAVYRTDRDGTVRVFRLGTWRFILIAPMPSSRIWELSGRLLWTNVEKEKP